MSPPTDERKSFGRILRAAAVWTAAAAACAGGGWWLGLLLARFVVMRPVADALAGAAELGSPYLPVWVGTGWGLVVGLASAVLFRHRPPGVFVRVAWGTAAGAAGGVLVGLLTSFNGTIACASAGAAAGLAGFIVSRCARSAAAAESDEEEADRSPVLRTTARELAPLVMPAPRVLAVVAASAGCLILAAVGAPSGAGPAVLALGLLGLVVAWALFGQERRLRRLEARVKVLEKRRRERRRAEVTGRRN
jgi:hypothetical protein